MCRQLLLSGAAVTAALLASAPAAAAQIVFLPPTTSPTDWEASNAQVGDVDGDEVPDVLMFSGLPFGTPLLYEFLGQGDGSFTASTIDLGISARWLRLVDTDGDNLLDLVVSGAVIPPDLGVQRFGVLAGDGNGGFGPFVESAAGQGLAQFEVYDFDQDRVLDVVGLRPGTPDSIRLLRGDGAGGFEPLQVLPHPFGFSDYPTAFALGDLDEDGWADLVVATYDTLQLHLGVGGGLVTEEPIVLTYPALMQSVRLDEFDGDGHLDLAFSANEAQIGGSIFVARGHGDASFDPATIHPTGLLPGALTTGDLDGDGDTDLLGVGVNWANELPDLLAFVNAGDAGFTPGLALTSPTTPEYVEPLLLADLDADARLDVVVAVRSMVTDSTLLVALNRTYVPDGPFLDLGSALEGTAGWPILQAAGSLLPTSQATLSLWNGLAGAPLFAIAGSDALFAPFKGGTLVPQPQLVLPLGTTPAGGTASWAFRTPPNLSGTEVFLQLWFADAGAVHGFAATTGLKLAFP
jgi:hypothetical protein